MAVIIIPKLQGGGLIKTDPDILCRHYSKYAENIELPKEYNRKSPLPDPKKSYDLIVLGTSVTLTGWVQRLAVDYDLKVAYIRGRYPDVFIKLLNIYYSQTNKKKTMVFYADIYERRLYKMRTVKDIEKSIANFSGKSGTKYKTYSTKLAEYLLMKAHTQVSPQVTIVKVHNKDELFYTRDMEGLSSSSSLNNYSENLYSVLSDNIGKFKEIMQQNNFDLHFVMFPTKAQQYEYILRQANAITGKTSRSHTETIQKVLDTHKINYLALEKPLRPFAKQNLEEGNLLWWRADTHVNNRGDKIIAKIIAEYIQKIR